MQTFEDYFRKNQYNLTQARAKSAGWFQQQVNLLNKTGVTPNRLIRTNTEKNKSSIIPGEMYMFFYDAKHKDTLPYWDRFPLVFPFKKLPDGFLGLNMHYLPYQLRIILLDRLMEFRSNNRLDETTRLKYSWAQIDNISKFQIAMPCVKRYLINHVQSPFKKIDSNDWTTALMMPVERFVGTNKTSVWINSTKGKI